MNKEEKKVEEAKVNEEEVLEEEEFFDDYDEEDLALAAKIHSAKTKAKKVGKVALVVGGIALLGVVGLGVAIAVGAAKKEEEESKKSDRDWDRYDRRNFDEGSYRETYSEPEATTESTEEAA